LLSAMVMAATVWVPMVAGEVQLAGGCAAFAAESAAGAFMRLTASGIENHCGAERPKRPAKSIAAVSKRSCWPTARYRSNSVSHVSSWSMRGP
jgi:hypothetical protein